MTSSHKFISIGFYIPLIGLQMSTIAIISLYNWRMIRENKISLCIESLFSVVPMHIVSCTFYILHLYFFKSTSTANLFGNIIGTQTLNLCPFLPFYLLRQVKSTTPSQLHCYRFMVSLELLIFSVTLSMFNFPLAIITSLLLIPISLCALLINPNSSIVYRTMCFTMFNPLTMVVLLYLMMDCDKWRVCIGNNDYAECFVTYFEELERQFTTLVVQTILNHVVHSSALFPILCIPFYAIYLNFCQLLFCN